MDKRTKEFKHLKSLVEHVSDWESLLVNPDDYHYFDYAFVIGHEFGPVAIVIADCLSDAIDEGIQGSDKLDCFVIDDDDDIDESTYFSGSFPLNLDYMTCEEIRVLQIK